VKARSFTEKKREVSDMRDFPFLFGSSLAGSGDGGPSMDPITEPGEAADSGEAVADRPRIP